MDVEIRTIEDDERADWVRAADTSFSAVSKDDEIEEMLPTIENDRLVRRGRRRPDRRDVGGDHDRMVVPGGERVPTAAVTMVGVQPTHRRRASTPR